VDRRGFIQACVAGIATVAIGMRVARGMPPIDLKDAIDTFRWELATDNYYYGLDTAKPWHVEIYRKICGDEWELMEAQDLMAMAEDSIQVTEVEVQVGPFPSNPDEDGRTFSCGKNERWPWSNTKYVTRETCEEYGIDPESEEEMEAAAVIAMSQGMAAYNYQGNGPIEPGSTLSVMDDIDVIWVPRIYTTEKALFRHG